MSTFQDDDKKLLVPAMAALPTATIQAKIVKDVWKCGESEIPVESTMEIYKLKETKQRLLCVIGLDPLGLTKDAFEGSKFLGSKLTQDGLTPKGILEECREKNVTFLRGLKGKPSHHATNSQKPFAILSDWYEQKKVYQILLKDIRTKLRGIAKRRLPVPVTPAKRCGALSPSDMGSTTESTRSRSSSFESCLTEEEHTRLRDKCEDCITIRDFIRLFRSESFERVKNELDAIFRVDGGSTGDVKTFDESIYLPRAKEVSLEWRQTGSTMIHPSALTLFSFFESVWKRLYGDGTLNMELRDGLLKRGTKIAELALLCFPLLRAHCLYMRPHVLTRRLGHVWYESKDEELLKDIGAIGSKHNYGSCYKEVLSQLIRALGWEDEFGVLTKPALPPTLDTKVLKTVCNEGTEEIVLPHPDEWWGAAEGDRKRARNRSNSVVGLVAEEPQGKPASANSCKGDKKRARNRSNSVVELVDEEPQDKAAAPNSPEGDEKRARNRSNSVVN